jgi:hypothetical protein
MTFAKRIAVIILVGCSMVCGAQTAPPPSWVYSTYFGGSSQDNISAQTRDSAGNIYVVGTTASPDFPTTPGVYEPVYPGPTGYEAVFVSKFSAGGSLVWSTFLGPGSYQFMGATGVQVDSNQNVYVAGIFQDPGFPTTPGLPNNGSVFVAKLNPSGSQLVYGTTLGGNSILSPPQLVLDSNANAFVTGSSGDTGACCDGNTGMIGPLGGGDDFWVAEINSAGSALTWSVQIGGGDEDEAYGLAIDSANKLYITGYSLSRDFPQTPGALDQPGIGRSFVLKLDPMLPPSSSLIYSALVGNPGNNTNDFIEAECIAIDQSGNAYVGAWTYNIGLFTSKWAFQPKAPTTPSAYVFELNRSGSSLLNGTYLGGGGDDFVGQVSVDDAGNVYVTGFTTSWDFLTTAYGKPLPDNVEQGFYVKLNPQFAAISSVEFGGGLDGADAVASVPDAAGGLWVTGYAGRQFPTTANAYQPMYKGKYDGFLLHTNFAGLCANDEEGVEVCTISADSNLPERIHFTAQATNVERAEAIVLSIDGMTTYGLRSAQFDVWLPVAPGTHTASVLAQDVDGQQYQDEKSFTVEASAACPMNPVVPSLTLCSPLNAAVIKGPLTIEARAGQSVPPATVKLYVDSKFVAKIADQGGSYTYTLQLTPGIHRVTVQGTDTSNHFLYTTAIMRQVQ